MRFYCTVFPRLNLLQQFYTDQNGDVKPGKKGIILNRLQWDLLVAGTDAVTEKLKVVETEAVAGETSKKKKKSDEKTMKTKKYVTTS